jgi:hypothetical protein
MVLISNEGGGVIGKVKLPDLPLPVANFHTPVGIRGESDDQILSYWHTNLITFWVK